MKSILARWNLLLFLAVLFGFGIAFWILPDRGFSEQENRGLQELPRWDAERFFSGAFAESVNDYFADQFPLRDSLVGIKGAAEVLRGAGENDGILLGKRGQLARRTFDVRLSDGGILSDVDRFDPAHVRRAAEGINRAAANTSQPFSVLLTGRTVDIAASSFSYPTTVSDELIGTVYAALSDEVDVIETVLPLRQRFEAGEAVYYRTDHHWTTLGAYYAYAEVLRHFGKEAEILPPEAFERQTLSDSFYGTAWSAAGMKWVEPDRFTIWTRGNEAQFEVIADGTPQEGFYSMRYLGRKDLYSVFLDGTHDVVTVCRRDGAERERLLILKDSFANSIAPFLAQHYDLVLLNLSSTKTDFTDVTAAAARYGADRILLVYTLENVITADKLPKLQ